MGRIIPGVEGLMEAAWRNTDNKNNQQLLIRQGEFFKNSIKKYFMDVIGKCEPD